jgi:ubiquinone/menaquinone biosynthesis C-methylase UbiE
MDTKSDAPSTSKEFDKIYKSSLAHWMWSDVRIPNELKELATIYNSKNSLELGCGIGIFSSYMEKCGIRATGVDFSATAIEKAIKRVANSKHRPTFIVGDVTKLDMLNEQFGISFDIGCFHCLDKEAQLKYVVEISRLLKPGATHLIWALDNSPSGIKLNHDYIAEAFKGHFKLADSKFSRRRIVASHFYWLVRSK